MASNRTSKSTSTQSARRKTSASSDAISFLTSQHREVEDLFKQFEKLGEDGSPDEKEPIVRMACEKLTIHSTIEEEIFYPSAREEVEDAESLLNEAQVEHQTVKELIETLGSMNASDDMFSATFTVLSEYVKHHVKEEEGELFPKVRKSDLDLDALGQELATRAEDLMASEASA